MYALYTNIDADADTIAMRDALVHLAAVVVGSTVEYTNLWYHMFSPEDLKGSYIPGFTVSVIHLLCANCSHGSGQSMDCAAQSMDLHCSKH